MKTRILASLLSLCLVVGLLPMAALAAEELTPQEIAGEEMTEPEVPAQEPAETTGPDTPAQEPAENTEPDTPAQEPVETTEPDTPAQEPAETTQPDTPTETTQPEAPAQEETPLTGAAAPTITGLSVAGSSASADDGNLYVTLPIGTQLAGKSFTLTTSEAVAFQASADGSIGELYVSSVSGSDVTLTVAVGTAVDTDYSITMTSTDGVNWTGSFSSSFDMDAGTLASAVDMAGLTLKAGSMVNTANVGNEAVLVLGNQDLETAQFVFCAPGQAVSTVTYMVSGNPYTWKVPNGALLPEPVFTAEDQEPEGWYYDEDYTQAVDFSAAVTGNVTLYAKLPSAPAEGAFMTALAAQADVLPIYNNTDWEAFVENASLVAAGQRVELMDDIDCGGAAYSALTFAGDFNGNNFIISNASFHAVNGNSGMFAVIGPDQKVCNLVLDNVTAKYAGTYSGVLAGSISGTEGHNALVQNVQVWGGETSGRSAGGLAGYVFFADVQYCSSRDTTITGMANGGGIGGISYGQITQCYSVSNPTALLSSGRGGIAGKNLEGGTITSSWCTYSKVVGTSSYATETSVKAGVGSSTDLSGIGLEAGNWISTIGTASDLDMDACFYNFS